MPTPPPSPTELTSYTPAPTPTNFVVGVPVMKPTPAPSSTSVSTGAVVAITFLVLFVFIVAVASYLYFTQPSRKGIKLAEDDPLLRNQPAPPSREFSTGGGGATKHTTSEMDAALGRHPVAAPHIVPGRV